MEEEKKKAYSEVVEILKLIDNEEKIEKIPFEVIQLIKNNSDPSYKPTIDKDKPLEEQNLKDETYSIIAWIANKYWNENITIEQNNSETIQTGDTLNVNEQTEVKTARYEGDQNETEEAEYETVQTETERIVNSNINNITETKLSHKASVYNDLEREILERCDQLEQLPILKSDLKWFNRIKQQVLRLLKILFRVKSAEKEMN